ncbi:MAG: histidine kinase [Prevotella sp.]|nr:histidine kinase [Prevotella sp.]
MSNLRKSAVSRLRHPARSLSSKLSIGILILAIPIFVLSLGVLFYQSRFIIRNEAVGHAKSVLNATMQQLSRHLNAIETATKAYSWLVEENMHPDSLLAITHRLVLFNPHIDGCSVSTEPYVFEDYGRHFSAYSVRESTATEGSIKQGIDEVSTVVEEEYEYFEKVWYKEPRRNDEACWVVYFDEADSLALTIEGLLASYSRPLHRPDSSLVGIISTDMSLLQLSKVMADEKPYPHSYFVMVDEEGRYYIHPDVSRLYHQTIFSGADPSDHADLIALGHEMTKGKTGNMSVNIDGKPCLVCYQPVPGTRWSLALICPDSDVLADYHKLSYLVVPLLIFGLLVILLLCRRYVAHAIRPLGQLLEKTQSIAAGNMQVDIPHSEREDVVGRLQNSFATMLQSLNFHIDSVRDTTEQTRKVNEELAEATRLAQEADRQKTAFIQNVSHQIRTPLNIIMGFAQILSNEAQQASPSELLSEEELKTITNTMSHNTFLLRRLVLMLFDSSDTGLSEELRSHKRDMVPCNSVARDTIEYINKQYPNLDIKFFTEVPDDFCISSNRLYLSLSLREVLYNAAKYSDGQRVAVRICLSRSKDTDVVHFIIEDTGEGIADADRERMFTFFGKIDDLSEGLGLGLPLAKRHAQNLGGDLVLDADYHDGCRFILEQPINSHGNEATT